MQRGGQPSLCWGHGEPWKVQERGRDGLLAEISLGMALCPVEWGRLGGSSEGRGALEWRAWGGSRGHGDQKAGRGEMGRREGEGSGDAGGGPLGPTSHRTGARM